VADVVLSPAYSPVNVVPAAGENCAVPHTSQSPAVSVLLVQLADVPLVIDVAELFPVRFSPSDPADAVDPFVTPVMLGVAIDAPLGIVTVPVKVGDASGAYGASSDVKPAPLTVLLADSVVNAAAAPLIGPLTTTEPEPFGVSCRPMFASSPIAWTCTF